MTEEMTFIIPIGECLSRRIRGLSTMRDTHSPSGLCGESSAYQLGAWQSTIALGTVVNLRPAKAYGCPTGLPQAAMSLPVPRAPKPSEESCRYVTAKVRHRASASDWSSLSLPLSSPPFFFNQAMDSGKAAEWINMEQLKGASLSPKWSLWRRPTHVCRIGEGRPSPVLWP